MKDKTYYYADFHLEVLLSLSKQRRGRPCTCEVSQMPESGSLNWVIFICFDDERVEARNGAWKIPPNSVSVSVCWIGNAIDIVLGLQDNMDVSISSVHRPLRLESGRVYRAQVLYCRSWHRMSAAPRNLCPNLRWRVRRDHSMLRGYFYLHCRLRSRVRAGIPESSRRRECHQS